MTAEAKGVQAVLDAKAEGYASLVKACTSAEQAAALLLVEKLVDVSRIQAQAIQDLPIEKVVVWDGGSGQGGLAGLGQRLMGALPPMHELARQVGLDLPAFLGKMGTSAAATAPEPAAVKTPGTPSEP
jgi:flotillin